MVPVTLHWTFNFTLTLMSPKSTFISTHVFVIVIIIIIVSGYVAILFFRFETIVVLVKNRFVVIFQLCIKLSSGVHNVIYRMTLVEHRESASMCGQFVLTFQDEADRYVARDEVSAAGWCAVHAANVRRLGRHRASQSRFCGRCTFNATRFLIDANRSCNTWTLMDFFSHRFIMNMQTARRVRSIHCSTLKKICVRMIFHKNIRMMYVRIYSAVFFSVM